MPPGIAPGQVVPPAHGHVGERAEHPQEQHDVERRGRATTVGITAGPGSSPAPRPERHRAEEDEARRPTSHARSISFAFHPGRPLTCHVAFRACSSVPTTPRPGPQQADARRRPRPPAGSPRRVDARRAPGLAASPVSPSWSTTSAAKSVLPAETKPSTAIATQQQREQRQEPGQGDRRRQRTAADRAHALVHGERPCRAIRTGRAVGRAWSITSVSQGAGRGGSTRLLPYPRHRVVCPGDPRRHRPRRIPGHIACVMDGNGRWAEQRGACPAPRATPRARRPCSTPSRARSSWASSG